MKPTISHTFDLPDEEASRAFARAFAAVVRAGDVLALKGQIGAGKTFFARSLIQQLLAEQGLIEDIPSPTFTLVQTYQAGPLEIWHSDLYRLTDPFEITELGLEDAFETALCLVEWPELLGDTLPKKALTLHFSAQGTENQRTLHISGPADVWHARLSPILQTEAAHD